MFLLHEFETEIPFFEIDHNVYPFSLEDGHHLFANLCTMVIEMGDIHPEICTSVTLEYYLENNATDPGHIPNEY